jgi:hypothetical protein
MIYGGIVVRVKTIEELIQSPVPNRDYKFAGKIKTPVD